ncbi:MAG: flavin reductase [Desulfobacterales bacterium]|nr:MAG: flavin reductase [Desulfobacterales bacterium]
MKNQWLRAFGTMNYGIYVMTTSHDGRMDAMVASWVSQVSYEPPLIAVAVHKNRFSHQLIENSGRFALHVLGEEQKKLIYQFMGSDPETKFSGLEWRPGQTGCPILQDCVAWFDCTLNTRIMPGNHTLFIGEVVDAMAVSDAKPLTTLDYRGQYIGKV